MPMTVTVGKEIALGVRGRATHVAATAAVRSAIAAGTAVACIAAVAAVVAAGDCRELLGGQSPTPQRLLRRDATAGRAQ
jgi:hypothetical protein